MSLPQREGRPALHISPEDKLPNTAAWETDRFDTSMNPLNEPVPLHKGDFQPNGWMFEAYDTTQSDPTIPVEKVHKE